MTCSSEARRNREGGKHVSGTNRRVLSLPFLISCSAPLLLRRVGSFTDTVCVGQFPRTQRKKELWKFGFRLRGKWKISSADRKSDKEQRRHI